MPKYSLALTNVMLYQRSFLGIIPAAAIRKDVLNYDRDVIGMILIIQSASASDAGTYRCTVQNQLGSDSRSFQVTLS